MNVGLVNHHAAGGKHIPAKALVGYKRVLPGEIVMNRMRAAIGLFAVARTEGLVSPDYALFQPLCPMDTAYLISLFQTPLMASLFRLESRGLGTGESGFLRLYSDRFGRLSVPFPSLAEQALIVRFLDHANRRIDHYIRAKRKLIALLNEQKQAIIQRAVTRGLEPGVKLKDSGVPWLGKVPSHWSLTPNRALMRIRKVLVGARHHQYQVLSLTKKGVLVRDMNAGGKYSSFWERSQEVRPGDLVFCLFDVEETPRTVGLSKHGGMISGDYTVMEWIGGNRETAKFVELFYIAMDDRKLLSPMYSGLRKRIPKPEFMSALTPIPPSDEMHSIVRIVKEASADVDFSVDRLVCEIALVSEYRKGLISDVVTGQLDVREAARNLPDLETEKLEAEPEESDIEADLDGAEVLEA
jgi:type I restriction enzyme S subunit